MLGLPYNNINVTKSKKTLKYYKQYREKVQSLVGDKIQSIINMSICKFFIVFYQIFINNRTVICHIIINILHRVVNMR